jgi:GTP-binding protein
VASEHGAPMSEASDEAEARARIERGRLFFARPWRHVFGAPNTAALRPANELEVAFAGRSNVGKSSLINALTGQKALARTSNTPGRTRELNFFSADGGLTVVDMPGYGYARAPKSEVAAWTNLVFDYLRGRANLRRVYLLIDARHGLKENDLDALKLINKAAVSCQVVLTKTDKLKASELAEIVEQTAAAIAKQAAAHPAILATSSDKSAGIDVLRAEIAELVTRGG